MVRLITYNIEYCEGIVGKWYQYLNLLRVFSPPPLLDLQIVEELGKMKPDILALVEADGGSVRSRGVDQAQFIGDALELHHVAEHVKYPFRGWMKMFHHMPILGAQENAIASRYSLSNVKYHMLHEGTKRLVIEATVSCPRKVTLLLAHLALSGRVREKQIKELVKLVNKIKNPVILMGDFNTFNGEKEIQMLLDESHLNDRVSLDRKTNHFTQPAWHPSRRLDYVLTSKKVKVNSYRVLPFQFSDHLPLMVDFGFRK